MFQEIFRCPAGQLASAELRLSVPNCWVTQA
jgi:hypothetical protein